MTAAPATPGTARVLRLGTRRSLLARTQSQLVADRITEVTGRPVELVEIVTDGDRATGPLAALGGTGVFVTALRSALSAGHVDLAVHSLKDLPTGDPEDLVLAAVPPRVDPRDVLVTADGATLAELRPGARVGTGSPRRAAQLRALGLGLDIVGVRGNVDTRIDKVRRGDLDGVVLAHAGLLRLGRAAEASEVLDPLQVLPAPGQGALAVETRPGPLVAELAAALEDPPTRAAVTAERVLLAELEAGCSAPVGALAEYAEADDGPEVYLRAVVVAPDGSHAVRQSAYGTPQEPAALGRRLAKQLLADGAGELMGTE